MDMTWSKDLFLQETPSSSWTSPCLTTAAPPSSSIYLHSTQQPGLSYATIAGLAFVCIGLFALIVSAIVFAFCLRGKGKGKNLPGDDDDDDDDGGKGGVICVVDVQEFPAEQAPLEIMTERKDLSKLSA